MNQKGRGSVVQIKGLWYARWRVQGATVYGAQGREDRDDAERDRLGGIPTGPAKVKKAQIPTLRVWAFECMEGRYGQKLADTTYEVNESIRVNWIETMPLGTMRLDKITRRDCEKYVASIQRSPAWVRRVAAVVSRLFTMAEKRGFIKAKQDEMGDFYTNPMVGVELPEIEDRNNRILNPAEASNLLSPQRRIDAIMLVALHTGMRKSEILRLQWGHVKKDIINVPGTKNAKSKAPVPLTPEVKAAIEAQPRRSIFVFTTDSGLPLSPRNTSRDVAARKAALGIPPETRLQDLRGTYGSLMIEDGADLKTVQTLMRHADSRTTIKSYLRSRQETQVAAVEKLRVKTGAKPVDDRTQKEESG